MKTEKDKIDVNKLDRFIEEHTIADELDGVKRTLVEFDFNEWIKFRRSQMLENSEEKEDEN